MAFTHNSVVWRNDKNLRRVYAINWLWVELSPSLSKQIMFQQSWCCQCFHGRAIYEINRHAPRFQRMTLWISGLKGFQKGLGSLLKMRLYNAFGRKETWHMNFKSCRKYSAGISPSKYLSLTNNLTNVGIIYTIIPLWWKLKHMAIFVELANLEDWLTTDDGPNPCPLKVSPYVCSIVP